MTNMYADRELEEEKKNGRTVEAPPAYDDVPQLRTTTERKLMAKIDWHVLPVLCVLYLWAFLDRYVEFLRLVSGAVQMRALRTGYVVIELVFFLC